MVVGTNTHIKFIDFYKFFTFSFKVLNMKGVGFDNFGVNQWS